MPKGKIAFALPHRRGYLVTDFQGHVLRTIRAPRGRVVVGRPDFNSTGERLWFLTLLGRGGSKPKLHVSPTSGRRSGRAHAVELARVYGEKNVMVSPTEDRIAIGSFPWETRGCFEAVIVSRQGRLLRTLSARGKVGVHISSWAPDGSRLVHIVNRWLECGKYSPEATLFVAARRGQGPDSRVAFERHGDIGTSAWSANGRRLAFSRCDGGSLKCRLVIADAKTGTQRIYGGNPYPLKMVWAAKTDEVVTARGEPNEGIWAFNPDSRRWRRLARNGDINEASANGNHLVINRGVLDVETARFWPFSQAVRRRYRSEEGAAAYFVR